MYSYKIKTSFVIPEMPNARANKTLTGFIIMIVHFYIGRKLDIIRYVSFQCVRTGSYPPDINRYRSHTGKIFLEFVIIQRLKLIAII